MKFTKSEKLDIVLMCLWLVVFVCASYVAIHSNLAFDGFVAGLDFALATIYTVKFIYMLKDKRGNK